MVARGKKKNKQTATTTTPISVVIPVWEIV